MTTKTIHIADQYGNSWTVRHESNEVQSAAIVRMADASPYMLYRNRHGGRPYFTMHNEGHLVTAPERFGPWETDAQWRDWVRRFVSGEHWAE